MQLTLYNTLTRRKEAFAPLDAARVRMYVCGPTVYDRAHIGNARPVIVFDVLYRLLRHLYGAEHVTYVRNITDVDDKINARAAERGISIGELTKTTYDWFQDDVKALGCLPPTFEPRATDYIEPMKELIERLIMAQCAYVAEDHVLFHVSAMPDYGKLAHRSTDDMIAGARVEVAPYKKDPMDFVLWKPSKPGEPAWESPARIKTPGRPGWHIECSAMSWKHLGETFDIHGGGIDLVFPHHENEIAQSRCAFGTPTMAQVWMHNGFVQMGGEKMAKSEGNVVSISELLQEFSGDVLRHQMLMTHYRQPIDWTERGTWLAREELENWAYAIGPYYNMIGGTLADELVNALSDDLNTADAITVLRGLYSRAKKGSLSDKLDFAASCKFLGFRNLDKPGYFEFGVSGMNAGRDALLSHSEEIVKFRAATANNAPDTIKNEILRSLKANNLDVEISPDGTTRLVGGDYAHEKKVADLVSARIAARETKNFEEADRIRDELKKMGVELVDLPNGGTNWKMKVSS